MDVFKENGKGNIHRIKSVLILNYDDENMARDIIRSIEVDNYDFVDCKYQDRRIICEVNSNSISSLIHTLDDLLSCVITAEDIYHSI